MEISGTTLLLLGFDLIVGAIIGFFLRKKLVEGNQANVEAQGRQIIERPCMMLNRSRKSPFYRPKKRPTRPKMMQNRRSRLPGRRLKMSSAGLTVSLMKFRATSMI